MKSYETIIQDDIRDGVIHGAAVLAGYPDHDFCDKGFGFAENTLTYPMNTDTVIDIASVTKATATITALLVCHSRGLIDFDAPFTDYLTDYQPKLSVPIRVRDLANHTSGFGDVPGEPQRRYFNESGSRMLRNMLTMPPPFPPTQDAKYACWNYILLAMIVERITGKTFSNFCRDEIFQPLGMHDTALGKPPVLPPERIAQTLVTEKPGQISDFVADALLSRAWRLWKRAAFHGKHIPGDQTGPGEENRWLPAVRMDHLRQSHERFRIRHLPAPLRLERTDRVHELRQRDVRNRPDHPVRRL